MSSKLNNNICAFVVFPNNMDSKSIKLKLKKNIICIGLFTYFNIKIN